jgi:ADP-ribosylglycohydrolase
VHDVLDPRDTVPDEAEQLSVSGYRVGSLLDEARRAAAQGDVALLEAIRQRLQDLPRDADWPYEEPDDDATLAALARGARELSLEGVDLPDRVRGAWLGRTVGNTLGKPVEGLSRVEMETYLRAAGQWPQRGYLPLLDPLPPGVSALPPTAPISAAGRFQDVPRDDDIDWTILALHVVETHGRDFTTEQIAAAWLDRIPFTQTYTAERVAYRNLIRGVRPPETATQENPYREWIGALIRADAFGYVSPGRPGDAAVMAMRDARLSHTANGIYGELWVAALVAAALAADDIGEAMRAASQVVPGRSRLAEVLAGVERLRHSGASAGAALDWVDERLGRYPWVHTLNNAALIAIGLWWGSSFMDTVGLTLSGGRDTDSNGATVGSVYGALHGATAVPDELVGTTHVRVRSAVRDFDRTTIDELTSRTLRLIADLPDRREAAG